VLPFAWAGLFMYYRARLQKMLIALPRLKAGTVSPFGKGGLRGIFQKKQIHPDPPFPKDGFSYHSF